MTLIYLSHRCPDEFPDMLLPRQLDILRTGEGIHFPFVQDDDLIGKIEDLRDIVTDDD